MKKSCVRNTMTLAALLICNSLCSLQDGGAITAKAQEVKHCLEECWGVDPHTSAYIRHRLYPLIENPDQSLIDDFINQSKALQIDFSLFKEIKRLPDEDGIYQAPKQHLVIFENPYVRILWGSTEPGEYEPLHVHAWKSLMVIIEPTTFEISYPDGTAEVGFWPVGVYALPAMERYACKNIGVQADQCIRFEVKD